MQKRWLFNLLLLLLVTGLAAVAWFAEREPPGEALLAVDPDSVESLVIQGPDREDLRLRRESGQWWITSPDRLPASDFHVRQVLEAAAARSATSYPLEEMEPDRLGLEPPRARLEFDGQALLYGGTEPIDGLRYIQSGERIHLVRDAVGPLLEGPWWNFIDRQLIMPGSTLVRVETPAYELVRDDGTWRLESAPADAERLAANWQAATALVVRQVRRQPDGEASIRLHFADGSVRRFAPASESGEQRLVDPERGLAYVLDATSMQYLTEGRLIEAE